MASTAEFIETTGTADGCGECAYCTGHPGPDLSAGPGQAPHARGAVPLRAAGAALAIATGVVALGAAGTAPAHAVAAPRHEGWDGSRYWFKSDGQWRWTSHRDIYLQRTRQQAAPKASGSWLPAPKRQGWDGSRYWFRSNGQWRWTSHRDVYLQRTRGSGTPAPAPAPSTPKPKTPPKSSSAGVERAVEYALAQLGKPYYWGGNGPVGYDCSGLVQQAYKRAGITLPRVASDQYGAVTKISANSLRRGDLLFWSSNGRRSGVHHVAVYLGGGRYVEAPRPGTTIRVSTLSNGYYPTFFGRP